MLCTDVGVRDGEGRSLVRFILENVEDPLAVDIALYLINCGCACGEEEKRDLLYEACSWGRLDVVKDLVEQHKVGEY